ncbi:phospholipase B1, membrane-associated-like [Echinops telfairi]|uniref:Phospholipase B1, membrane-associated n=1 Tax=Echinops telfairi TaxID=9371 RepID=A0ABM0ZSI7_ECHTE|nr:phospholipase B1, membrane-associated-like [Echinops telfairi]
MLGANLVTKMQVFTVDRQSQVTHKSEEEMAPFIGRCTAQLAFQSDWKLIHVFFSNASQCHLCPVAQQTSHVMETMGKLTQTLDYLHQEVSPQEETCGCTLETSSLSRAVMQWSYQETWKKLLASSKYNKQRSFAVVFQPIFSESDPLTALEAPLLQDPTSLALHLWNSMMEPAGEKDELFNAEEREPLKCPTQKREGAEVRCPDQDPSDSIPTSVHRLKPADIKVIGALGDSITAGNGAGSKPGDVLDVLTQYRGLSWSAGGDENISKVTTLPNILREFNPSLKGFSLGKGKENSAGSRFNQAVAGAKAERGSGSGHPLSPRINFQEDWKIITLFIGGNDLCSSCKDPVPRAFVNLVVMLEIITLRELYQEKRVSCPRLILRSQCPCVLKFDDNTTELATLIDVNRKYQEESHLLVESGRYDTRDDFTVVVQPFLENVAMPKTAEGLPDHSFFAPDCFHFSAKAHAQAACGLWNNMLEPINQKTSRHEFEIKVNVTCPDQAWPFLSTYKNLQNHGTWLPCMERAPSPSPPTSVHALRPADVQVVAALGDSLTAGNGIATKPDDLLDVTTQYRGLSYSSGGDGSLHNVTTLPNILREFNPNLIGYAVGTGDANNTNAFLNQAVPGAKAEDLVDQAHALVQRMKADTRVDFQLHWKVITVLIGGADLCDYCMDSKTYSAANFFEHLRKALDVLHREVPRALVNLVDFMSPSVTRQVFLKNQDRCPVQQASLLCNCVLSPRENSQEEARLAVITQAYQNSMRELVESGRYDTREDFSVVLQPFFQNLRVPEQQLQPLGMKSNTLNLAAVIPVSCPTKDEPFLRTPRNSNYTYPTKPAIEGLLLFHQLQPADIQVVAALGDALTTAVGARPSNSSDLLMSWRGLSWSIGGDGRLETHTTLPNILKMFNPQLQGFSTGTQAETAGLNAAAEGARARDMPAQARDLVELMKKIPEINLEKDWKLITLLIGSNDLCHYCENPEAHTAQEYVRHIQQTLDIFYEELPRAFINVVQVMELAGLHQGHGGKCAMPLAAQSNCTCLRGSWENASEMQMLKQLNWNFQSGVSKLAYQHRYLQREDFAIVVQPFFQNTLVPLNGGGGADLTFFSDDCFHFSERGHAELAIALWNNMVSDPCGGAERPYFYTLRNSQLLPEEAKEPSTVIQWAVPVAAGLGLVVGAGVVLAWRAMRG